MEKIKFTKLEMFKLDDNDYTGDDGVFFSSSDKENFYSVDEETKSLKVAKSGKYILNFSDFFYSYQDEEKICKINISKKKELVADQSGCYIIPKYRKIEEKESFYLFSNSKEKEYMVEFKEENMLLSIEESNKSFLHIY